jgi:hypothetical protein
MNALEVDGMCMNALRDQDLVARKDHQCVWCPEKILKGQKYHLQAGEYEGEMCTNRYHPECFEAGAEAFRDGDCDFEPQSFKRGTREAS